MLENTTQATMLAAHLDSIATAAEEAKATKVANQEEKNEVRFIIYMHIHQQEPKFYILSPTSVY